MTLPLKLPYPPMEARSVDEIPVGDDWAYEPKWDGFRCLAFRDGKKLQLQSKAGKPLDRYFPDLIAELQKITPSRFVLDGEIVIPVAGRLSFDDLLMRIHPAASRVRKLADDHPAIFIVFDLLVTERGTSLFEQTYAKRRPALERFADRYLRGDSIRLSPATGDVRVARRWLSKAGINLDGVVAKRTDLAYSSGSRDGMQKIKRRRTVDCVVGGFRYAEGEPVVGSLLLGLYDDEGLLHHVGFTSSLKHAERKALTQKLERLVQKPGFTGRAPGGPSRWSTSRSEKWQPLKPKLVVEVEYDHFTGGRFRHGTMLMRWRPDKSPGQCTTEQLGRRGGLPLSFLDQTHSGRRQNSVRS